MENNPYLKAIYVYNSYADKHFEINFEADENSDTPFRHLILTGKNGSGKTTILKCINEELNSFFANTLPDAFYYNKEKKAESLLVNIPNPKVEISFNQIPQTQNWVYVALGSKRTLEVHNAVSNQQINFKQYKDNALAVFKDKKKHLKDMKTLEEHLNSNEVQIKNLNSEIIKGKENLVNQLNSAAYVNENNSLMQLEKQKRELSSKIELIIKQLIKTETLLEQSSLQDLPTKNLAADEWLQFLVNKKQDQSNFYLSKKKEKLQKLTEWFDKLEINLAEMFEQPNLKLDYDHEKLTFFIELPNQVKADLNQLPDGYSSFLAIAAEIWVAIEAEKLKWNADDSQKGIVVVDEIENHLHPSLQEKIMPFLTGLFPKIQFIVATHSPIVIASIDNTTVFDLTTKETRTDAAGDSISALMMSHFGLDSTYSAIARKFIKQLEEATEKKDEKSFDKIVEENKELITDSLNIEVESLKFDLENG